MKSKTLSIAVTYPFTLGIPGGGPQDCMNTAIALAHSGADVTVLPVHTKSHDGFPRAPVPDPSFDAGVASHLQNAGVRILPVKRNALHFILDSRSIVQELESLNQRCPIDAVISYWQEGRGIREFSRRHRIPHGVIAAASYSQWLKGSVSQADSATTLKSRIKRVSIDPYRKYVRGPLHEWRSQRIVGDAIRQADFLLARSDFTKRELVSLFAADEQRITVAHCGIDAEFRACSRQYKSLPRDILYVGALVHRKGVFDAIEAIARLRESGTENIRLRIAGWGNTAAVYDAIHGQQLERHVSLLGGLDRAELIGELLRADVALLPSYSESFGLAVAEAQATGLPVVAYAAGAVPEVIDDGTTGWLAPVGQVDVLARLLANALDDPAALSSAGKAAKARVSMRFSWDDSADAILKAVHSLKSSAKDSAFDEVDQDD